MSGSLGSSCQPLMSLAPATGRPCSGRPGLTSNHTQRLRSRRSLCPTQHNVDCVLPSTAAASTSGRQLDRQSQLAVTSVTLGGVASVVYSVLSNAESLPSGCLHAGNTPGHVRARRGGNWWAAPSPRLATMPPQALQQRHALVAWVQLSEAASAGALVSGGGLGFVAALKLLLNDTFHIELHK